VDKKWESRTKDYSFINERIIIMKIRYDRGYIIVIGAHAPEQGTREETISIYKIIQKLLDKYNKSYSVLLIGDMNRRVGNQQVTGVVGTFGEEIINEKGVKLRELADFNELKITNTFFRKKDIHKYTWNARGLRSLINHIIVNSKLARQVIDTNVFR
jgi:hypothetical protein